MLKYILMILGGVIFIAGYYFMQQNEGRGKTMMFYSLFTYAGLTLVILSGARVLDPFLKPAFEDQKEIGTKKNITPRGSGDSFSVKANKKESTKKTKKNNNQIKRSYSTGNKKYRKK